MIVVHGILSYGGAVTSVIAAFLWVKSTTEKALSPDTSGWGALVGGMVVVPGPKGERIDLMGHFQTQSIWNGRADKSDRPPCVRAVAARIEWELLGATEDGDGSIRSGV